MEHFTTPRHSQESRGVAPDRPFDSLSSPAASLPTAGPAAARKPKPDTSVYVRVQGAFVLLKDEDYTERNLCARLGIKTSS